MNPALPALVWCVVCASEINAMHTQHAILHITSAAVSNKLCNYLHPHPCSLCLCHCLFSCYLNINLLMLCKRGSTRGRNSVGQR